MKINDIPLHDMHIHTNLSLCSNDKNATVENYIECAKKLGIERIGFTDHMWDSNCFKPKNAFYREQTFERQMSNKNINLKEVDGVSIRYGVETEFSHNIVGITSENANHLDYVIVPHSHLHIRGFVKPFYVFTPNHISKYMIDSFKKVAENNLTKAIAHPFDPSIKYNKLDEIYYFLTTEELTKCFKIAKENNKSIEINISCFGDDFTSQRAKYFFNILSIAKSVGCKFYFGSDTHCLEKLNRISPKNFTTIIDKLEITLSDISSIVLE